MGHANVLVVSRLSRHWGQVWRKFLSGSCITQPRRRHILADAAVAIECRPRFHLREAAWHDLNVRVLKRPAGARVAVHSSDSHTSSGPPMMSANTCKIRPARELSSQGYVHRFLRSWNLIAFQASNRTSSS